jgi:hypothetical protein
MINSVTTLLTAPFLYIFFCATSVDPKAQVKIYAECSPPGTTPTTSSDPTFAFFGYGALVWVLAVVGLAIFNGSLHCTFEPQHWLSVQTVLAVTTIAVCGKIFASPALEVRKSLLLKQNGEVAQPFRFRVYDSAILYPANLMTGFAWKFTYVAAFALLIWISSFFGLSMGDKHSVIPTPLFLAWTFACMGRVSLLMIHLPIPHAYYIPIYGLTLITVFVVWLTVELILKGCGAQLGILPTYSALLAGGIGMPLSEILVGGIAAVFALALYW